MVFYFKIKIIAMKKLKLLMLILLVGFVQFTIAQEPLPKGKEMQKKELVKSSSIIHNHAVNAKGTDAQSGNAAPIKTDDDCDETSEVSATTTGKLAVQTKGTGAKVAEESATTTRRRVEVLKSNKQGDPNAK
jgi:hypothetical protein